MFKFFKIGILLVLFIFICFITYKFNFFTGNIIFIMPDKPKISDITVNSLSVNIDNEKTSIIYPATMNSLYPNKIRIKKQEKKFKVKALTKDDSIEIHIFYPEKWKLKHDTYTLYILPKDFPEYTIQNKGLDKGYVFTSFHCLQDDMFKGYAVVIDSNGKLLYWHGKSNQYIGTVHIKKWEFDKNTIFYSLFALKGVYKKIYYGYHYILDAGFNVIDKVRLIKTEKHSQSLYTDVHDIIVLGKKHYIVCGYEEKYINNNFQTIPVLQEIKDNKVVLDWTFSDYKELMEIEKLRYYEDDYKWYHITSIAVDPTDNNIVISFSGMDNAVKIDRQTGKIIWQLGGEKDYYNLSDEEKFQTQNNIHYFDDNLIIFDNNHKRPSRILKYKLDEKNYKLTTKEIIDFNQHCGYTGSVQFLKNNKILVNCNKKDIDKIKIITKDKNELWSLNLLPPYNTTYRAYFYEN